jgi:very-short-patch-repair endonuclease
MESRTRVVLVTAGFPEPELNQDIFSATGAWLGRVDMLWRRARVVGEYEGDGHRSERRRWRADIERVRRMEAAGFRVIRITADDIATTRSREALVALVRHTLG